MGWPTGAGLRRAPRPRPRRRCAGPTPQGAVASLLPAAADPFFRAERLAPAPDAELAQGFAVLVVLDGEGKLGTHGGADPLPLARGDAVLVPWAAGPTRLDGDARRDRLPPARRTGGR